MMWNHLESTHWPFSFLSVIFLFAPKSSIFNVLLFSIQQFHQYQLFVHHWTLSGDCIDEVRFPSLHDNAWLPCPSWWVIHTETVLRLLMICFILFGYLLNDECCFIALCPSFFEFCTMRWAIYSLNRTGHTRWPVIYCIVQYEGMIQISAYHIQRVTMVLPVLKHPKISWRRWYCFSLVSLLRWMWCFCFWLQEWKIQTTILQSYLASHMEGFTAIVLLVHCGLLFNNNFEFQHTTLSN